MESFTLKPQRKLIYRSDKMKSGLTSKERFHIEAVKVEDPNEPIYYEINMVSSNGTYTMSYEQDEFHAKCSAMRTENAIVHIKGIFTCKPE